MLTKIPFASRIQRLRPSLVREILNATQGDTISLAGGLPAPEAMPTLLLPESGWQQYGVSEGERDLREAIASALNERGFEIANDQILITSGSQQGLDLLAKAFIEEGSTVLCESPTYLAALQVFDLFGAITVEMSAGQSETGSDDKEMPFAPSSSSLEEDFARVQPKVIYAQTCFSNPTGVCWSRDALDGLIRLMQKSNAVLIEDDPYRDLFLDEAPLPAASARLSKTNANWAYLGSFSKSLLPGLRVGFMAMSKPMMITLVRLKQAADLHTCRLSQRMVYQDLVNPNRPERLNNLRNTYRKKRDAFADSLNALFPNSIWNLPNGGLFFWVKPNYEGKAPDTLALLHECQKAGVVFLPGLACYKNKEMDSGWLRLNYSHATIESAREGLRRMALVLGRVGL